MKKGAVKKLVVLVGLLIAVVVGYIGVGPFTTLHQIKAAVEQQDSEKLSENIDFPTLRTNLKEQLNSALMKQAPTELKDNLFGALGIAFASKLVEGMVDSFVTPGGLANLMAGKKPRQSEGEPQPPQDQESSSPQRAKLFQNARYTYDSPSKFSVWVKDDRGDELRFVLIRNGLSWKLSNIVIPMNL